MSDVHNAPNSDAAGAVFGTPAASDRPAVPAGPDVAPPSGMPNFSEQQLQEMAAEMIKHGMPRDQVEAALKGEGIEPQSKAPDTRTDEEKEFDAFFAPPASPEGYKINYVNRLPEAVDSPALVEFNRDATAWLSAMRFPETIGPSVIEQAIDAGQAYNRMSESQQQLWKMEQTALFERMTGGAEKAAERTKLAAQALARAPKAFTDALYATGALHDALIIMQLANQGERLVVRGR